MSKANRIRKESQDVANAEENAKALQQQMLELEQELQDEVDALEDQFDGKLEQLEEVLVRASSTNIHIPLVGLLWQPYWKDIDGFIEPAF